MRRNACTSLGFVLLASVALGGCSAVRPFSATALSDSQTDFNYVAGRASQSFGEPVSTVQPAVLSALEDLRVIAVHQTHEAGTLIFRGTTADNRAAVISLRPQQGGGTKVMARVGVFGDEPLSRALMDRVAIRLGTLPPTAIPIDPPSQPSGNPFFSRGAVSDREMLQDQADAPYKN